jgi:hypothetical protein
MKAQKNISDPTELTFPELQNRCFAIRFNSGEWYTAQINDSTDIKKAKIFNDFSEAIEQAIHIKKNHNKKAQVVQIK